MKLTYKILIFFLLLTTIAFAGNKKVLVEIFTNSHCPLCPPAHSAINKYLQTANGNKIEYIYYHMAFPYSSDELYKHNTSDSQDKNTFYGSFSSTPQAFFNGIHKSNNYDGWASELDVLTAEQSKIDLSLSGSYNDSSFTIKVMVTKTADISENDLTINYVVVEDNINYAGRNGISVHNNVMRKIVNPTGDAFDINLNETKELSATVNFNKLWNKDNIKIIVFIQSSSTKKVFQSASISLNELSVTGVKNNNILPAKIVLNQNYPNPFNPTTTIKYTIQVAVKTLHATSQLVQLKIYDVLGKEVSTLVNKQQSPGNYSVIFDASNLPSGIYYYRLTINKFSQTRKMLLLK